MENVYDLCRKTTNRGTFKTLYDIRLADESGQTRLTSKTRNGYLAQAIEFRDADDKLCGTFGPDRRVAASAHVLKSEDGTVIAEIKHGALQFAWGGRGFACVDAAGEMIYALVPGETATETIADKIDAWSRDQLVLMRGDEAIGHTGGKGKSLAAHGVDGIVKKAAGLPGFLIDSFRDEVLGQEVDWPEQVVGRLTLNDTGGGIDERFVMAVLVFKLHYHDLRNM